MTIVKLGGGFIAAVYPNAGIDRMTGKVTTERIYGRDEEELKQRIRIRFPSGFSGISGASREPRNKKVV